MKSAWLVAIGLTLGGCSVMGGAAPADIHAIKYCAELHPPPPQANVKQLGLLPVYFTRSAASDDAAVRQWYADMDSCTKTYKPPAPNQKS